MSKGPPYEQPEARKADGLFWDAAEGHWVNDGGKRVCGYGPNRKRGPCRQWQGIDHNGLCGTHHSGGRNQLGPANPAYKHGRYSRCFGRFGEAVEAALADAALLNPNKGVAAAVGALEEAGERLAARDTPEFRARAAALHGEAMDLLQSDPVAAVGLFRELGELLDQGVAEDAAFAVVVKRADSYRVAVNDAIRLRLQASTAMSVQDLTATLDGLVVLILEVCGRDAALEIAQRFDRERLRGKLAQAGFQLGARAIAEKETG